MKLFLQIGVVFGLFWASQCIEQALPFPFPASVISLLLLLVLLLARVVKVEQVRTLADFLLGNMGFFFVPVSVSIMNYGGVIWENALGFFTVCIVSTFLTFAATAYAVRLTVRLMKKKEDEA